MSDIEYKSIQPFIPSGKDHALARRFFTELGFVEQWVNNGIAGFAFGDCRFLLQRYTNEAFASNLMMKLVVPNLDAWWILIHAKSIEPNCPGVRVRPPTNFP